MMDAAATSSDAETVVPILRAASQEEALLDALKERLHSSPEMLETRISMTRTRMHRFPHRERWLAGAAGYVVPSVVAIGPYHRGLPDLQEMEEVKHAAAHWLCRGSGHTVEEVYAKVFSVAGDARRCYEGDASLAGVSEAEFAAMMFLDGCFLVWYIAATSKVEDALATMCYNSSNPDIFKDIFLLENQIPWAVLEALMEFRSLDMDSWIDVVVDDFFYHRGKKKKKKKVKTTTGETSIVNDYSNNKAPHLLGLLRSGTIRSMPSQKKRGEAGETSSSSMLPRGAVYLAQIGVKITASKAEWFANMDVQEKLISGELSLSPLFLGHVNACRLWNMAALEVTGAFATSSAKLRSDGCVVSSYLSTMAMLMDREEDVHELRKRGVLSSSFSNARTLAIFKSFGELFRPGNTYYTILGEIDGYMRRRPVRIALYKFFYNNYGIIATILSIAGVLASILKALYSLKKPERQS